MTLLSDMRKVANAQALKKKEEQQQTKAKTTTTTAKKTTNLTQEQKQQATKATNNVKAQWLLKWAVTTTKQVANTKAEQNLKSQYSNIYKQMWSEWFSDADITKAIRNKVAQENAVKQMQQNIAIPDWMVDRTDKQKNIYRQLVSEWFSETDAKNAINNKRKEIDDSMTTWEKWKTRIKAFSQWVSDVWQRQIGHAIDWAAWKVANKLEWTALAEWIRNAATNVFGEDAVRQFQEENKNAKPWDMTKWNILTEKEQNSGIWQRWQKWWQYGALAAESMAMWWLASGWAKAVWTAAWSKLVWWLAGTVIWAGEWTIWADAFTRWLEDRAATKWERITWAALWWVFGGISWYRQTAKSLAQNKQLQDLVQDTSKAWRQRAIAEWRITTKKWLMKTETIQELSQKEKDALNIIKKEWLWNSKDPWKLVTNIQKNISKTAKEMSDDMKNIEVKQRWKQELKDNLRDIIKNPEDWTSSSKTKINNLIRKVNKATNADDLWQIRKEYDSLFSAWQKAWYGKWWTTETMYNLWQNWRKILNNAINNAADSVWNWSVKEWMKKLSTLITAEDNITQNLVKQVWKEWLTTLWKLIQWARWTTRKVLWTAAVWWGWAAIWVKIAWNNSSSE